MRNHDGRQKRYFDFQPISRTSNDRPALAAFGFEIFADGKGLICDDLLDDASAEERRRDRQTRQRGRALLLHQAGADMLDIFATLESTGESRDYAAAIVALNSYFVRK